MEILEPILPHLVSGMLAIWGLLDCFFGYRIFRYTVAALGFLCGGLAGAAIGFTYFPEPTWVPVAVAFGSAVFGGFLAWSLLQFGLALLGSLSGGLLVSSILTPEDGLLYWIPLCAAALIGALLAVFLMRVMVVLLTALTGSFRFVIGVGFFFGGIGFLEFHDDWTLWADHVQDNPILMIGIFVLALLGALFQILDERRRRRVG